MKAYISIKGKAGGPVEISKGEILLGRAPECDFVVDDPYVSRKQLILQHSEGGLRIRNIGKNPVVIGARRCGPGESIEVSQDMDIQVGKTRLFLKVDKGPEQRQEEVPDHTQEKTVILNAPRGQEGARIIVTGPSGQTNTYSLSKSSVFIGRSRDADVYLPDKSVSRRHAVIEPRQDGYYLKGLSPQNPPFLNKRPVVEKRLFSGDQIDLGVYSISFVSDRPEDQRPVVIKRTKARDRILPFFLAIFLVLLAGGGFFAYKRLYLPWMAEKNIRKCQALFEKGKAKEAKRLFDSILANPLPEGLSEKTFSALSGLLLKRVEEYEKRGDLKGAKALLKGFLKRYGTRPGTKRLWARLDELRYKEAMALEEKGAYLDAMGLYSLIHRDSPLYDKARSHLRKIWLEYQTRRLKNQQVQGLLEKADVAFERGHYLRPMNQNAYALYQAVLSIAPENKRALKRIEDIKRVLETRGKEAMAKGNCKQAISWFERYLLVDPMNQGIKRMKRACQDRLASSKGKVEDIRKERVKRLLEESGAKSSWIMKYLFEEEKAKGN